MKFNQVVILELVILPHKIMCFISISAKVLLDKGADPNKKDFIGNTPLHLGKIG